MSSRLKRLNTYWNTGLSEYRNIQKKKLANSHDFQLSEALHAFQMKGGFLFCLKIQQGELKSKLNPLIGPYYGNIPAFPALTRRMIYSLPITLCLNWFDFLLCSLIMANKTSDGSPSGRIFSDNFPFYPLERAWGNVTHQRSGFSSDSREKEKHFGWLKKKKKLQLPILATSRHLPL